MKVESFYSLDDNKFNFLTLSADFRAEEEFGIVDFGKSIVNGTVLCELEYISYKTAKIPCLVFNRTGYDREIDLLKEVNNSEIERKLKLAFDEMNKLKKSIKLSVEEIEERDLGLWVSTCKQRNNFYEFGGDEFIASFKNGQTLVVMPNPFYSLLPKEYFKKGKAISGWHNLKKKYLNQDTLKEALNNKKDIFNKNSSLIEICFNSYKENGLLKLYNHHKSGLGGAIAFIPKSDIEFTLKNDIFPYEFAKENKIELITKSDEELKKQIEERALYNMQFQENNAKKEIFNLSFKKSNVDIKITSIKQFENVWYYWLQGGFKINNLKEGWTTEDEVNLLMEDYNVKPINKTFLYNLKQIFN